jgi:hypothetical protein
MGLPSAALHYAAFCILAALPIATSAGITTRLATLAALLPLAHLVETALDTSAIFTSQPLRIIMAKSLLWVQMLHIFNLLFLTQSRRVDPEPFNLRIWSVMKMNWRFRAIGTPAEAKNVPHFNSTGAKPTRLALCIRHTLVAAGCLIVLDVMASAPPPHLRDMAPEKHHVFGRGGPVTSDEIWLRLGVTFGTWISTYLSLNAQYSCLAVLCMVVFKSDPEVWRPGFGSVSQVYSVRKFWG